MGGPLAITILDGKSCNARTFVTKRYCRFQILPRLRQVGATPAQAAAAGMLADAERRNASGKRAMAGSGS
jgi:hypothetical protein